MLDTATQQPPIREWNQRSAFAGRRGVILVYALTSFLSAFLLFEIQLIVSKHILPWFGGSAAVWTTSMLVFQVLLLAGYTYSHLICLRLPSRLQVRVHVALLCVSLLGIIVASVFWPSAITPTPSLSRLTGGNPALKVALIILSAAGFPFFVLSTTAPLLQRWFARTAAGDGAYRLYSVSNLGSLLGLLAFPFLLEPTLPLRTQGILWSALFTIFAASCSYCAWVSRRDDGGVIDYPAPAVPENGPSLSVRLLWFLLAACAPALLLATTNVLCQEIISLPLLWVVPLAVYLLSFILCFDHPRWYQRAIFHPLFAFGILLLGVAMKFALRTTEIITLPVLLFVACIICHGELVRLKPGVARLTSFYLSISAGGALGGVFVAVIAPQIFKFFTEFQISLAASVLLLLSCLFLDAGSWLFKASFWIPAGVVGGVLVAAVSAAHWIAPLSELLDSIRFYPLTLLIGAFVLLGALIQSRSPVRDSRTFRPVQVLVVALAAVSMILLYQSAQPESMLFRGERNFYGALRIYELAQGGKALFHGQTLHGAQLNPPNDHLPMAYYGPQSGIGVFLRNHPKRNISGSLRVGVVGLGAGTLAVYGGASDSFRYYEIDPAVIELSTSARPVFSYVRDSAAHIDIEEGDARLLLQRELSRGQAQDFDLLVLDAFSGDAVPVHLLTREAFDIYWQHLNPSRGVIAIHLSSRHINLLPVIEGVSSHYHAASLINFTEGSYPFLESLWVFLAKQPEDLQIEGLFPNPPPISSAAAPRLWTDDYSDIFRLLY